MEAKLTAKERKQIIYDHLNDIPNTQYEVRETSTGTYRVYRRSHPIKTKPTTETPAQAESPQPIPIIEPAEAKKAETIPPKPAAAPPKQKRNVITNEDIMLKLNELHEAQNKIPQRPPPEQSTPKPPVDSTIEIESKKMFEPPKPQPTRRNDLSRAGPRTITSHQNIGRRRLVLV